MSVYLSIHLSVSLSDSLSVHPFFPPSPFPPTLLSTDPRIHAYQHLSIRSVCSPSHSRLLLCLSAHPHTLPCINFLPTHQFNVKLILPPPNSSTPSCPYRTLEYVKTEWVGVAVTLLIRTQEMLGSNLGQAIQTKAFRNIPQSLSEDSATASRLDHYRFLKNLSKSSLAYHPVPPPPHAVQPK
jgi:hypothetical protein